MGFILLKSWRKERKAIRYGLPAAPSGFYRTTLCCPAVLAADWVWHKVLKKMAGKVSRS